MIFGILISVLIKGKDVVFGDFNMYFCFLVLMESGDRKLKFFFISIFILLILWGKNLGSVIIGWVGNFLNLLFFDLYKEIIFILLGLYSFFKFFMFCLILEILMVYLFFCLFKVEKILFLFLLSCYLSFFMNIFIFLC